jgi:hypothetical protein
VNINTAYSLVVEDVRESYPDMEYHECLEHVWQTLSLQSPAPVGATTVHDDGSQLAQAYRLTLEDLAATNGFVQWMASQNPPAGDPDAEELAQQTARLNS